MKHGSRWRRLRHVFRQDPGAEVDDELEFHLEERVRDYIARGMEPEAARKAVELDVTGRWLGDVATAEALDVS